MNTSAEKKQTPINPTQQPTPVIIKIGDGGECASASASPGNGLPVTISSAIMPFKTESGGTKWEMSSSTIAGRLVEVSIWDYKTNPVDIGPITPSDTEPTSVTIYFDDNTQLVLAEEGQLNTQDVYLSIQSDQVSFDITSKFGNDWLDSGADFSGHPTRIVMMQGQNIVPNGVYEVTTPNLAISPSYNRLTP